MTEYAVELRNVSKRFPGPSGEIVAAVKNVTLQIRDGEFFSLLGPSGCGKTTSLRMIAGFELPTEGEIFIHGKPMGQTPAFQRPVNTVFQQYALFPHLTIGENVAFGLEMKHTAKPDITRRVLEALQMVRLPNMDKRRPKQLSGGQQQRIALARALVNRPEVLLLDEPLGALDLKLRKEMQLELKTLQREVGITFIYVTHDQEEALTMSDRLAVFNHGRIEQLGSPAEVYERPATEFVAGFVGVSNLVRGPLAEALTGLPGTFTVRPEKIRLAAPDTPPPPGYCRALGRIRDVVYLGMHTRYLVELDAGGDLTVVEQNLATTSMEALAARGRPVALLWDAALNRPLEAAEGRAP